MDHNQNPRRISVFGSTGSVGQSTLKVLSQYDQPYQVRVLTAQTNVTLLAAQAQAFQAEHAVIADESLYRDLKDALSGTGTQVHAGRSALLEAAEIPADWIMASIVGMAGLEPLIIMMTQGKGTTIAIANKEPLVAAGDLVMAAAAKSGVMLLPVDSEHNAVFQCLEPLNRERVEKITLTASGGPFRTVPLERFAKITPEQALRHPNWDMGAKISIDSATMMNKALEVIEAKNFFGFSANQIEVVVHPQSIIHSMVTYADGSTLAQMSAPDMCVPIAQALAFPNRMKIQTQSIDFTKIKNLDFEPADKQKFPFVPLVYEVLQKGTAAAIAMNAANEVAVASFLSHQIGFLDIYTLVQQAVIEAPTSMMKRLEDIIEYDRLVRFKTESRLAEPSLRQSGVLPS